MSITSSVLLGIINSLTEDQKNKFDYLFTEAIMYSDLIHLYDESLCDIFEALSYTITFSDSLTEQELTANFPTEESRWLAITGLFFAGSWYSHLYLNIPARNRPTIYGEFVNNVVTNKYAYIHPLKLIEDGYQVWLKNDSVKAIVEAMITFHTFTPAA